MTSITHEALCRNEFCPEPRNPDWHECIVCGNPEVEHAHVVARSRAPVRRLDRKGNVVALCHKHHELQTLNKWAFHEQALPFEGLVHQWLTDERGATVWKRDVRASTGEGKDLSFSGGGLAGGSDALRDSLPSPADVRGPSATDEEADESEKPSVQAIAPASSVAPDAANQARTPASTSVGGDGMDAPPAKAPSPPISESLKPNGLDLPSEFTFEDWTNLAGMVAGMNKNRQWWAGDLVLAGERFGERATNFWNDLGYRWESLSNAVRVCRRFPLQSGLRFPTLSFAHHAVVYALDDDEAAEYLIRAAEFDWTVKQLREAVHGVKPRTVRYSVESLREALAAWPGEPRVRNNARRWAEAWLDYLEGHNA